MPIDYRLTMQVVFLMIYCCLVSCSAKELTRDDLLVLDSAGRLQSLKSITKYGAWPSFTSVEIGPDRRLELAFLESVSLVEGRAKAAGFYSGGGHFRIVDLNLVTTFAGVYFGKSYTILLGLRNESAFLAKWYLVALNLQGELEWELCLDSLTHPNFPPDLSDIQFKDHVLYNGSIFEFFVDSDIGVVVCGGFTLGIDLLKGEVAWNVDRASADGSFGSYVDFIDELLISEINGDGKIARCFPGECYIELLDIKTGDTQLTIEVPYPVSSILGLGNRVLLLPRKFFNSERDDFLEIAPAASSVKLPEVKASIFASANRMKLTKFNQVLGNRPDEKLLKWVDRSRH